MFKFIDLFAGIGGFRIPLEEIGGNCVFSSEIDKHSILTYEANFKELPHGDIKDISEKDIPEHDLLAAGFPCQPFSIAGKMRGFDDTRGTLFFEIARIVKYHKPKVILLENVKNLVSHDNGNTISVIKNTLEALNYDVYMDTLNAKYFWITAKQTESLLGVF